MNSVSQYLVSHMVAVYFVYGLAFFVLGIALAIYGRRKSAFRFAAALIPLALFGLLHGAHEWFEMFQLIAARDGYVPPLWHEVARVALLVSSFFLLLAFALLLIRAESGSHKRALIGIAAFLVLWLAVTTVAARSYGTNAQGTIALADVLVRYFVGVPAALLAAWALMSQQRSFRESDMPEFGANLVWCAAALLLYGLVGQLFVRPSPLPLSSVLNSDAFLDWFGIPVQLFRAAMAAGLAFFMLRVLGVFEAEERRRLQESNQARLEAQYATLETAQKNRQQLEVMNRELTTATRRLSLLVEVSGALQGSAPWPAPLIQALTLIVDALDFATAGLILLPTNGGRPIQVAAEVGYRPSQARNLPGADRESGQNGATGRGELERERREAAILGEACLADGLVHCTHADGTELRITLEEALHQQECRRHVSPALQVALPLHSGVRIIGSLVLTSDPGNPGQLTATDLAIMVGIAQGLGLFIENALLHSQAHARERTLAGVLGQVVSAQEGERKRIARELHDATGQSLTAIGLGLRAVENDLRRLDAGEIDPELLRRLDEVLSYSNDAMRELHGIIADLRPPQLDELGLKAAIQWYADVFAQRWNIPVHVTAGSRMRELSPEYNTVLFRIMQEALRNVARHACATCVHVELNITEQEATLTIRDDGRGFEPARGTASGEEQTGWGLAGMSERVNLVGGRLDVRSSSGAGTTVAVHIPLVQTEVPSATTESEGHA